MCPMHDGHDTVVDVDVFPLCRSSARFSWLRSRMAFIMCCRADGGELLLCTMWCCRDVDESESVCAGCGDLLYCQSSSKHTAERMNECWKRMSYGSRAWTLFTSWFQTIKKRKKKKEKRNLTIEVCWCKYASTWKQKHMMSLYYWK